MFGRSTDGGFFTRERPNRATRVYSLDAHTYSSEADVLHIGGVRKPYDVVLFPFKELVGLEACLAHKAVFKFIYKSASVALCAEECRSIGMQSTMMESVLCSNMSRPYVMGTLNLKQLSQEKNELLEKGIKKYYVQVDAEAEVAYEPRERRQYWRPDDAQYVRCICGKCVCTCSVSKKCKCICAADEMLWKLMITKQYQETIWL